MHEPPALVGMLDSEMPCKPSAPSRKLLIRATVGGALLMFFAAVAGVVVAAGPKNHALAPADARYFHARLVDFDQGLRTQLVRVRPHGGVARAQNQTRDAVAGVTALSRAVRTAGGSSGELLRLAIGDELRFLDATGSVLMNPRSSMLADLPALDVAARRAIAAIDGPRARRTGGVKALQRLRRRTARPPAATPA